MLAIDGPVSWDQAGEALALAAATAGAAAALPEQSWYDVRRLDIERLWWTMRRSDALEEFVAGAVGPLLAHDRDHKLVLMPTLRALCGHGGRKADAARQLHLHRQALYHRIARIEQLLDANLGNPDTLAALTVALRALPFVDASRDQRSTK